MKQTTLLRAVAMRVLKHTREDSVTGCWRWTGAKDKQSGYGRIKFEGVNCYAHRISYFVFVGDIEPALEIMHLCDQVDCVNPKHLEKGTHRENIEYQRAEKFYGDGKPLTRQIAIRFPELISEVPF